MKTKPILFSTPMVQAILEGVKTQTRRIVKFPNNWDNKTVYPNGKFGLKYGVFEDNELLLFRLFPKYEIDDILWVRETFQKVNQTFIYKANNKLMYDNDAYKEIFPGLKWKPSIFMSKEAARIFLKVTNVRVERLHDITESDAIAEGIKSIDNVYYDYLSDKFYRKPYESFCTLWQKINGNWHENPFVWVYEFELTEKPENFI